MKPYTGRPKSKWANKKAKFSEKLKEIKKEKRNKNSY